MKRKPKKVLVVEDDRSWNIALQSLYRERLPGATVQGSRSGEEALQRIRTEFFDLISLDINLSRTHPKREDGLPDYSIPGYDGLDVLEKAAEWNACTAVVVISGLQHDDELRFIVTEKERRLSLTMTPLAYLNRYFPGRSLFLFKNPDISLSESLSILMDALTEDQLRQLTNTPSSSAMLPPPYTLDCSAGQVVPRILVYSRGARTVPVQLQEPSDRFFIWQLVEARRSGSYLSDAETLEAYRNLSSAQIAVDGLRRRLRKLTVEPEKLLTRTRASRPDCRGWALHPSVKIRGAATVTKRGSNPEFLAGGLDP